MGIFLTAEEMAELTGYKRHGKQIEALRQMGIPCRINARGRPIVTRSVIEGAAAGVNPRGRGKAGGWQSRKAV
ncbi:DUF4224 domain-containing protein [Neisseria elongata]|uniref:DUF4224 domain-containing protein n=1 Tax=Neisseria elongata TaxID=495 RepID=UPI000A617593|nr:DUF4224 domain-containing protein [Neisseria elongata]